MENGNKPGLHQALLAVQSKALKITRDETATVSTKGGAEYSYNYASLEAVWKLLRDELVANELVVVQEPQRDVLLTTVVHASSGQSTTSEVPLITAEESRNHMQDLGGAITYARRYALYAIFNIITDDDDNANATKDAPVRSASPNKTPSEKQLSLARDLLTKAGYSEAAIATRLDQISNSAEASALLQKLMSGGAK